MYVKGNQFAEFNIGISCIGDELLRIYIYVCVLHVYVIKHDFPRDRFTSAIITFDITKDSKDGQQPCIKVRPAQFPSQ